MRVLERAERLGLISELELQVRPTALTAFAKGRGVNSWRFPRTVLQRLSVDDPKGLEPGEPWRQLEQHSRELTVSEPQHERADESERQHGVPTGPEFRWRVVET